MIIFHSQDDFWASIIPTLDIKETISATITTGAEIDYFHSLVSIISKDYVLRLHITVDDALVLHVFQAL